MTALHDLEPVYVIGVGWHRYRRGTGESYVPLGLTAVRSALADAGVEWTDVGSAYVGTALLPMSAGRPMLRHLGATGIPIVHVENASASGSAAFRQACIEVASGLVRVAVVVGVDKPGPLAWADRIAGTAQLADELISPFSSFAMRAQQFCARTGATDGDIGLVAVKNHGNGALNPNAHRQQARTLDEVMGGKRIAGALTSLQCCPVGEGAAAVVVASATALRDLGIDTARAVRVIGSAAGSQRSYDDDSRYDSFITRDVADAAFHTAGVSRSEVDVVELHDAFSLEELQYLEAMGIAPEGGAARQLRDGEFDIGGRVAVSTSGGLLAMGHPIGPTGVGQIGEIALQLRGEAGPRQHPGARVGLAHMVGLGAVCYIHLLRRD